MLVKFDVQVKEDKEKGKAALRVKNDMSILLMRYGVVKKANKEKDYLFYSYDSSKSGYWSVSNAPVLPADYAYATLPIRGGFLYVYYETDDKWSEYQILDAVKLRNIVWDEKDYNKTDRVPKRDPKTGGWEDYTGIPVGKNKVVWVAWSEVQWGAKYATKVLTTEDLRKGRMQKIDIDKWKKGEKQEDIFKASEITILACKDDIGEFEQLKKKVELLVRDKEEQNLNLFMALNDPMGAADDVVSQLNREYEHLDALVACALIGTDPKLMRKDKNGNFDEKAQVEDEIKSQYEAAYSVGLTLYLTFFNGINTKPNETLEKYRKRVNLDTLKALLGVQKRAEQRKVIHNTRDALGAIFQSNYYQNVLLDFSENSDFWRMEGEMKVTNMHYGPLSDLPHYHDQHLDLYNKEYSNEDKWRKFIADCFSGEIVTNAQKLLSADFQFKKADEEFQPVSYRLYLKDYSVDSISETASITEKLLSNLSTALSLYGPYMGTKIKNSQLFIKLNKLKIDGNDLIVQKEMTIGKLNEKLENQIKGIRSKKKRIIKKQTKRLSETNQTKIAAEMEKFRAKYTPLDSEIKETRIKVLELFKKRDKFASGNSKVGTVLGHLLVVMDIVNLGFAITEVRKNNSYKNKGSVFSASMSLASSALSLSTQTVRSLDLKLTRTLFQNVSIRLSTRISWVASIVSAIIDGMNAYERINNRDYDAALFYALATVSGTGVAVGTVASIGFGAVWGGPVAWICLIVGLVAGLIVLWFIDNEFETFLTNSIFGENIQSEGISPDLSPHEVMARLYQYRNKLDEELKLSDDKILNMRDFEQMDIWLRELFLNKEDRCEYSFLTLSRAINKGYLGNIYCLEYLQEKLQFTCSFTVPSSTYIEFDCILYLYLVSTKGESCLIEIDPERMPVIEKKESSGLYVFNAHYPTVHQQVSELVRSKVGQSIDQWHRCLNRDKSCYYLTYRICFNANEKENSMPGNQEYYVMSLPFIGYQETSKNSYSYNPCTVLKSASFDTFSMIKEEHELINCK